MQYYINQLSGAINKPNIETQSAQPLGILGQNLQQYQHVSTIDSVGQGAYKGMVWYGKFQTIGTVMIGIVGIVALIYGIILFFTDESNWVTDTVKISKINSSNKTTCDKDTISSSNSKNQLTTSIVYNCGIYFQYNNKEIFKQITNNYDNYTVDQNITIYYDKNNPNNDPEINKIFISKYWWIFILCGLISMLIGFLTTYFILYNDDAAAVYGTGSLLSSIFNR